MLGMKLIDLVPANKISLFLKKKDNFTFKGTPEQVAAKKFLENSDANPLAESIVSLIIEKKGVSKKLIESFTDNCNISGEAISELNESIVEVLALFQKKYGKQ